MILRSRSFGRLTPIFRAGLVALWAVFLPAHAALAGDSAAFMGDEVCSSCHALEREHWSHTVHAKVFLTNPRTDRQGETCEACHGPGSAHVEDPELAAGIIRFSHGGGTPVAAMNDQCLGCHGGAGRTHWTGSSHERGDLACSDCHNPMARFSEKGLLVRRGISETCFTCHQQQRAEFRKRSHMPVPEGKMSCTDCHNPHGSVTEPLLKAATVNQVCYACHAEKRGPFLFEHAPVRENCLNCHLPHGSNHDKLLVTARPILCQQCHSQLGHPNVLVTQGNLAGGRFPDGRALGRSCQNCHAQIHGSNHPSGPRFQR